MLTLATPVAGLVLMVMLQKVEEWLLGRGEEPQHRARVSSESAGRRGRGPRVRRGPAARWR
jgi:hypothetical protein